MNPISRFLNRAPVQLMMRLRRVGGLFVLFIVVLMAAVHWTVDEILDLVRSSAPSPEVVSRVTVAAERIDTVLVIAAGALVPVFVLAAWLVRGYVRRNHLQELGDAAFRKSQFVALATYELRNPLTVLLGHGELLRKGGYGPVSVEQEAALTRILDAAGDLKHLLTDVLDHTNLEAGRIKLAHAYLDFNTVVEEAVRIARATAERQGISVFGDVQDRLMVTGDPLRMRQVLVTLLIRAVNSSPVGGTVTCRTRAEGATVIFSVTHGGQPVSEEDARALFTEIRRVRSARAAREGLDLDLAICRRLVELQGGTIGAQPLADGGLLIRLGLPHRAPTLSGGSPVAPAGVPE